MEEAEGYKQRVIANAEGDACRFKQILVEYGKAPEVTRERMYLDTMQQIMTNTSKVMVDQKGGSNLLYLPLDKLIQMTGASAGIVERRREAAAMTASRCSRAGGRTHGARRDAFRSRDREARP